MTIPELEELALDYNPPRGDSTKSLKAPETGIDKRPAKTWIFHSEPSGENAEEADRIVEEGPADERFAGYTHTWYSCWRSRHGDAEPGDFLIIAHTEDGETKVWPAAEIWDNKVINGRRFLFVSHARSDAGNVIPWKTFKDLAAKYDMKRLKLNRDRQLMGASTALITEEWPQHRRRRYTRKKQRR